MLSFSLRQVDAHAHVPTQCLQVCYWTSDSNVGHNALARRRPSMQRVMQGENGAPGTLRSRSTRRNPFSRRCEYLTHARPQGSAARKGERCGWLARCCVRRQTCAFSCRAVQASHWASCSATLLSRRPNCAYFVPCRATFTLGFLFGHSLSSPRRTCSCASGLGSKCSNRRGFVSALSSSGSRPSSDCMIAINSPRSEGDSSACEFAGGGFRFGVLDASRTVIDADQATAVDVAVKGELCTSCTSCIHEVSEVSSPQFETRVHSLKANRQRLF